MIDERIEDIDGIVEEILGPGSDPEPEKPRYSKICKVCGAQFSTTQKNATTCNRCRWKQKKAKQDQTAEQLNRAKEVEDSVQQLGSVQIDQNDTRPMEGHTESTEGKKWVKIPKGRHLSDFFSAEDIYSKKAGIAGPLRDEVEVVVALEEQICAEHGLTFGQLAEAVAALRHYKAVLERIGSETKEEENES